MVDPVEESRLADNFYDDALRLLRAGRRDEGLQYLIRAGSFGHETAYDLYRVVRDEGHLDLDQLLQVTERRSRRLRQDGTWIRGLPICNKEPVGVTQLIRAWDSLRTLVPKRRHDVTYLAARSGISPARIHHLRNVRNCCAHPVDWGGWPVQREVDKALELAAILAGKLGGLNRS